jgi:hypothetical protein
VPDFLEADGKVVYKEHERYDGIENEAEEVGESEVGNAV